VNAGLPQPAGDHDILDRDAGDFRLDAPPDFDRIVGGGEGAFDGFGDLVGGVCHGSSFGYRDNAHGTLAASPEPAQARVANPSPIPSDPNISFPDPIVRFQPEQRTNAGRAIDCRV
jgi:hypothetical protein